MSALSSRDKSILEGIVQNCVSMSLALHAIRLMLLFFVKTPIIGK